ncbi:MAG: amidohydrolase [Lachnospiraceae bacterium]|nr:amidohydrolase [Lachnospiraceae bacterium]
MENSYLSRAREMMEEIRANRRTIHGYAELAFDLPQTVALVMKELKSYGYEPKLCGKAGVTCTVGKPGKCILLRADMDALPMYEKTGLPFASKNKSCHSCGHDSHTAMLLAAAKMLKEREDELEGTVKFMFQPDEEDLAGAKDMIRNGILKDPKVDAAIGLHIAIGTSTSQLGRVRYVKGPAYFGAYATKVKVYGKSAHGSMPYEGVDALNIAAHIIVAANELVSREVPCTDKAIVTFGLIHGGDTCNTIGGYCEMEGAIRTADPALQDFLFERLKNQAECIAASYRGRAEVEIMYGIGPLVNDPDTAHEIGTYCQEVVGEENVDELSEAVFGTEDFTAVCAQVPAVMLNIGAGSIDEGYDKTLHHEGMTLDEDVLPYGAAVYAHCAEKWLKAHA